MLKLYLCSRKRKNKQIKKKSNESMSSLGRQKQQHKKKRKKTSCCLQRSTEANVRRCYSELVFLKISQNSQEKHSQSLFFNKVAGMRQKFETNSLVKKLFKAK